MFEKILGDDLLAKLETAALKSDVLKQLNAAKLIADDGGYVRRDSGEYIPREKFTEEQRKLKEALAARDKDIEELQKKVEAGGNAVEEFEKMKTKHKEETKSLNEALKTQRVESAVEIALLASKVKNQKFVDLLKPVVLRHADKFVEHDGKWTGIPEVVKALREDEDYRAMFGETKIDGDPPTPGAGDKDVKRKRIDELVAAKEKIVKSHGALSPEAISIDRQIYEASRIASN